MQTVDAVARLLCLKVVEVNQVDVVAEETLTAEGVGGHLVQTEAPKAELRTASALQWPSVGCLELSHCTAWIKSQSLAMHWLYQDCTYNCTLDSPCISYWYCCTMLCCLYRSTCSL